MLSALSVSLCCVLIVESVQVINGGAALGERVRALAEALIREKPATSSHRDKLGEAGRFFYLGEHLHEGRIQVRSLSLCHSEFV